MHKELFVTLTKSDNTFLAYPCQGWLELFETGTNGSLMVGVFRRLRTDGSHDAPVTVRNCEFAYTGGRFKKIAEAA